MPKHILIVEDEESLAFLIQENLAELGPDYTIEVCGSGIEALAKVGKQPFDLVISDLCMPAMDGLTLLSEIHCLYPDTHLMLMTAYGDSQVETKAKNLKVSRYITKPFHIEELIATVRDTLSGRTTRRQDMTFLADERFEALTRVLKNLQTEISAQCILLADTVSRLIAQVGDTTDLDVSALISLLGGGSATSFELAHVLHEPMIRNLSYHEGTRHDIYSASFGDNLFLSIVYAKPALDNRIGTVWYYTRQAIDRMQELTDSIESTPATP
jgi:two-component system response regulator (stage 0 sporulation protein F)